MNDYPLEVERAEETRYRFTAADEIAQACDDARRSMLGAWLVVAVVVLTAVALCFVRRH